MAKVAFIQTAFREQFGTMYLSACLKRAGHEVEVFITSQHDFMKTSFNKFNIIAFSSSTPSYKEDLEYAYLFKIMTPNAFIIFGGPHPTFYPEEVIKEDCVDAICIGEGYEAIIELADAFSKKDFIYETSNILNTWVKQRGYYNDKTDVLATSPQRPKYDINKLPMPDYGLYYDKYPELAAKPTKPVFIVHGCPYKCSFCWNEAYNKSMSKAEDYPAKIVQCMKPEKAIDEIKELKEKWGFKWLQFLSDNMTINKEWLGEFMELYRKEVTEIERFETGWVKHSDWSKSPNYKLKPVYGGDPTPFLMNIRCNEVDTQTINMLKVSGCDRVDFGVEHGNDEIRNGLLIRGMSKEHIIKAALWFRSFNIRIQTSNIVGLPTDSLKKSIETVKLNQTIKPEMAKCCIYQPFKGTSLYEYCEENDLLQNMDITTGTAIQIGHDGRGDVTKIKLKDEKALVRLSFLFDFFVQRPWLNWAIGIICRLPLNRLYRKYYGWRFKKQENEYK